MTRRTILAALTAAPLTATGTVAESIHPEAGNGDVIRQGELQKVLNLYDDARRRCIGLNLRLNAGATIEPGALTAKADKEIDERALKPVEALYLNCLDIDPQEN